MVCYARMQTILYFHHGDDYASRLRLEGINAFARTLDWNVQCYEELVSARTLKTLREFWHPVGAILCPNNRREEFDASLLGFFYDAFDFLYVILHIGNACCGNGGRHGYVSKVRHRLIMLRNVV